MIKHWNEQAIHLIGWGAAPGPLRYDNATVCEILGLPPVLAMEVERKIGTVSRNSCVDLRRRRQVVTASEMAAAAATRALERAGAPAKSLDAVIAVSTIQDHYCPSTAVSVQKRLGLRSGLTFDLGGGCGVWAQGVVLAAQFLAARLAETVLVVSAEPLTRLLWTARRAWEALAFGDGAAAMIFSTAHDGPFALRRTVLETVADLDGCRDEIMSIPILGDVLPALQDKPSRFDPVLPELPYPDQCRTVHRAALAARWGAHYMARAVRLLGDGIDREQIYVCPHQPSRVVLDAVREELGLDAEQIAHINPRFGNLSSASSPTAFVECFVDGPARYPWTVLAPIGTGLTYGGALLERLEEIDRPDTSPAPPIDLPAPSPR